jgi:alpha-tubulin suppressor-like RCC1 family protein
LGDGTTIDRYIPIQIGTDSDWDSISAGYQHVIALKNNGALYSWGQNDYGQLGNGTTNPVATPTVIPIAGCNLANAQFQTSENQCTISPNPAQNELNIFYKGFDFINTVLIYDNSGKIVFSTQPVTTNSLSASFSIANLQAGQYIVVLKNNNKTIISKQLIKI